METDLQRYGNGFAKVWKRICKGMETDLQRYGNGFANFQKIWKQILKFPYRCG